MAHETDVEKPPSLTEIKDEFYEGNTTYNPTLNRHCKYKCFVNDLLDTTEIIVLSKLVVKITFVWFLNFV